MSGMARLLAWLRSVETRHWLAAGVSLLLHLAVLLGLQQLPPGPPQEVTFEIALQPAESTPPKPPKMRVSQRQKGAHASHRPPHKKKQRRVQHPPLQDMTAAFVPEKRPPRKLPAVQLPSLEENQSAVSVVHRTHRQAKPPYDPAIEESLLAATPLNGDTVLLAAQGGATTPSMGSVASGGEAGMGMSAGLSATSPHAAPVSGGSVATQQGMAQPHEQGTGAQGGNVGPGQSTFSASSGRGQGLNITQGRGASLNQAAASVVRGGGEPQGERLSISGVVSSQAAAWPQGQGGLAAGHSARQASVLSTPLAQGQGQRFSISSQAGGQAPSREMGVAAGAGPGGAGELHRQTGVAGSPGATGGGLAHLTGAPVRSSTLYGGSPVSHASTGSAVAAVPGTAAGHAGREPGAGGTLGQAAPSRDMPAGRAATGRGGAGLSAAGDPGRATPLSGGDTRAGSGSLSGEARFAQLTRTASGGGDATRASGNAGAQAIQVARVRAGAGSGQAPVGNAAGMSRIQPEQKEIMREDSRIEPLDVIAPSTFCPLPGHAPSGVSPVAAKPAPEQRDLLPSYAGNNPNLFYPMLANIQGVEGRLILRVQVQADGTPGEILFKKKSGNALLDDDARQQIARWRFTPARKQGQPVTAWVDVPVNYRLSEGRTR